MLRQCFRVAGDRHRLDGLDPLLLPPQWVHGRDFQFQLMVHRYVAGSQFRHLRDVAMKDEPQIRVAQNLDVGQTSAGAGHQYPMDRSRLAAVLADAAFQMHYFPDAEPTGVVLADAAFQMDCFLDAEPVGVEWRRSKVAPGWGQRVQV